MSNAPKPAAAEPFRLVPQPQPQPDATAPTRTDTEQLQACRQMVEAARLSSTRFGRIIGEPGTGKTTIARALAEHDSTHRICCFDGIGPRDVLVLIAAALGQRANTSASAGELLQAVAEAINGQTIIIDEANHLGWRHLERLRYLADEAGGTLILIGTTLLEQTFRDHRGTVYLRQLARRIGARQIRLEPWDPSTDDGLSAIQAYLIRPRFGLVPKKVAKLFGERCQGNWGLAAELADGCARIMQTTEQRELTDTIIRAAAADMGGLQ